MDKIRNSKQSVPTQSATFFYQSQAQISVPASQPTLLESAWLPELMTYMEDRNGPCGKGRGKRETRENTHKLVNEQHHSWESVYPTHGGCSCEMSQLLRCQLTDKQSTVQ